MSLDKLSFSEEKDFQNYLAKSMRSCGWQVELESIPERCQTWDNPHRADLICSRRHQGSVFRLGLELKFFKSHRQGAELGKAIKQVGQKYRHRKFKCPTTGDYSSFDLFGLVIFFNNKYELDDTRGLEDFACGLLNEFGLGFGAVKEDSKRVTVQFRNDLRYVPLLERKAYEATTQELVEKKMDDVPVQKIRRYVKKKEQGQGERS